MADVKISALPLASTPLAGTEVLPIVQSATTDQVSVANLTAGRSVSAASLTLTTTPLAVGSGGTGLNSLTAGRIPFGAGVSGTDPFGNDSTFFWDNTNKWLGVGTGSPGAKLHVSGGFTAFQFNSGANYPAYNTYFGAIGTNFSNGGSELDIWNTVGSGFAFRSQTAASTQSCLMYIGSGGNVGIGTTSPAAQLDVRGNSAAIRIGNYNFAGINFYGSSVNTSGVFFGLDSGGGFVQNVRDAGYFAISTNNTERARIDSSGNLLVGTTSSWTPPGSLSSKIYVNAGVACGNSTNSSAYGVDRIQFNYSSFYVLNEVSSGVRLDNGSTAWAAQSDIRLKNVTGRYTNALSDIAQIDAFKFTLKSDADKTARVGVSAQSAQKVVPEAVSVGDDGYLWVRYPELTPLIITAIQELAAEVAALKGQING